MFLRHLITVLGVAGLLAAGPAVAAGPADVPHNPGTATAVGTGGAVATGDSDASRVALSVLEQGGNAIDAAVAAAGVLSVTEPYLCGLGGGGFLVAYLADQHRVVTVDHRETAPATVKADLFIDPATAQPYPFPEQVTSGLGVGVPGTVAGWHEALRRYGTLSLDKVLMPAIEVARRGFVVDDIFAAQTAENLDRFRDFTSTRALFLTPDGDVPAVGSVLRNPELAKTLETIATKGPQAFYRGKIADDIVATVQHPPVRPGTTRSVRPGTMTAADLGSYRALIRPPTHVTYHNYDVFGMGPPSSGGSTVGEILTILDAFNLGSMPEAQAQHLIFEASRLAFADRNAYLGDPAFVDIPLRGLLSEGFATERRALIGPTAASSPVAAGNPYPYEVEAEAGRSKARPKASSPTVSVAGLALTVEGGSTTHLTVSDRFGNVVAYTFTIESHGGSGMVVPGRGFLLNNELTDFNPVPPHPNAPQGGKRPRSSIAPTIVMHDGRPVLALGAPGGSTIITTVAQLLVQTLDLEHALPEAIAAPRASQRNTAEAQAEPAFLASPEARALEALGHRFASVPELGAATGIAFLPDGRVQAVVEPTRRGGGTALVEHPKR